MKRILIVLCILVAGLLLLFVKNRLMLENQARQTRQQTKVPMETSGERKSPTENLIAFTTRGDNDTVGVYDPIQQTISVIYTIPHGDAIDISWAPTGRYFAVQTLPANGLFSIIIFDAHDQTSVIHLEKRVYGFPDSFFETYEPEWSWNGKFLYFKAKDPDWDEKRAKTMRFEVATGKVSSY